MGSKRIVIIGGGFGGVYTYLNLRKRFRGEKERPEVTFVSKDNYFLFTPLLHEVATGGIRASDIVQPIRQIADGSFCRVIVSPAKKIDLARRIVSTERAAVPYDYLIIATGATAQFFEFEPESVYALKTMEDALRLKNRILEVFDAAAWTADSKERTKLLTFIVVGGGPTGVELACEMDGFIFDTILKSYPRILPSEARIHLVHGGKELVDGFHPKIRKKTLGFLRSRHAITLVLNSRVEKIGSGGAVLENGMEIESATIILAAGVRATCPDFSEKIKTNERGQILVNEFLQIPDHSEIFALGDAATVPDMNVPQTAQAAVQEAEIVARNIAVLAAPPSRGGVGGGAILIPFRYREKGQLISLGRFKGAAHIGIFNFSGWLAWWLWHTIYAAKIIGWPSRLRVISDWMIDLFYRRDISKLTDADKK